MASETVKERRTEQESVESELLKLRLKVQELEAKLDDPEREHQRRDAGGTLRDISERSTDESGRLLRGLTHAYLEQVRLTANVLSSYVDNVMQRNRGRDEEERESVSRLVDDAIRASNDVLDEYFDIPRKVVDKLHDVYHEDD